MREAPKCGTRQPRNPATSTPLNGSSRKPRNPPANHFLRTICLAGDPTAKSPQQASARPMRGKTMRQMARLIQAKETP